MPSREILQLGNPLLWEKSVEVLDVQSTETKSVTKDLSETLAAFREASGYGRGIAAPPCLRCFMRHPGEFPGSPGKNSAVYFHRIDFDVLSSAPVSCSRLFLMAEAMVCPAPES